MVSYNNSSDLQATEYNVLTGGASNVLNNVAPSSTSGIPLVSNGSSSQPSFTTAVVAGGGTGVTSAVAYAPVCGGTSTTGALQSASTGISTSGYVFTSTGASSLPTWQAAAGGGSTVALFQAYLSGNQSNVTGDGTAYSIPFNETSYNVGTCLNTGTGVFTAPTTGKYLITGSAYGFGTVTATQLQLNLVATAATYYGPNVLPNTTGAPNVLIFSMTIPMTAADTAYLVFEGAGGSKTIGAGGTQGLSTFSATYLST